MLIGELSVGGIWEFSVFSSKFFCKFRTVLKIMYIKKKLGILLHPMRGKCETA